VQSSADHSAHFVSCLAIDLIGSTRVGLDLTTAMLDRFNISLVEQINPHLQALGLENCLVKFTGDGWLIMTPDANEVPALCCLALIVANGFQREMARVTDIERERIPALRLAICSGRDVPIRMPDGRGDWVGDSARRAVRISGYCFPNEILIDEPIRLHAFRDFNVKSADIQHRPPEYRPKRMEELISCYVLGLPKAATVEGPGAPPQFVYTMQTIEKAREVTPVGQRTMQRLSYDTSTLGAAELESLRRLLEGWNTMMRGEPTYERALDVLKKIDDAGLSPDLGTYKILIDKSPDYESAASWARKMLDEGIQPDSDVYADLITRAPDYVAANNWVESMRRADIRPNLATYNSLIQLAPDQGSARAWLTEMQAQGIRPDRSTHRALLAKGAGPGS
jgi:class 3 adenylate cyclase